ncbi:MAG: hypothetical protein RI565_10575, partial [Schleiferiaceae bacterium]|nr:hypothetical protein [Schleiferiaceae bacterium]
MKSTLTALICFLAGMLAAQQSNSDRLAPTLKVGEPAQIQTPPAVPDAQSSSIWSEDFTNGIPNTWSQNGSPATALWEYRGPNTTPDNTTGSRGAFVGTNGPINSSTASNGFVIFDSDYYDNGGNSTNLGGGSVPAPHTGRLITEMIDLSNEPQVELKFESFVRRFQAGFFVAFSTDGGATYTDSIEFYPEVSIAVNAASPNAVVSRGNISSIVGGQDSVVMQFIFDGTRSNANGSGYYFWQLDDVELRTPSRNQMFFTTYNGSPEQDMIYDNNPGSAKYGIMHVDQITPVHFDANIRNYGSQTQTNVQLRVEIRDANTNSLVQAITSSPGCASLATGDTCSFDSLTTSSWTPPATPANYEITYRVTSDSIPASAATDTATFDFFVSDRLYSTDRNEVSNYVGTNSASPPINQLGVRFNLKNEDPDRPGLGKNYLEGVRVSFSNTTDSTASIEFAIWDTTGFQFNSGFPAGAQAIKRFFFTLDSSAPGNSNYYFPFGTPDSIYDAVTQTWIDTLRPYALDTGTYFLTMTMLPNAPNGVVRIANDASFPQPGEATIMQLTDGNWYGGFTSSTFEAPAIRLQMGAQLPTSSSPPSSTPCTQPFFSEYIEGSGNNKGFEIYN